MIVIDNLRRIHTSDLMQRAYTLHWRREEIQCRLAWSHRGQSAALQAFFNEQGTEYDLVRMELAAVTDELNQRQARWVA